MYLSIITWYYITLETSNLFNKDYGRIYHMSSYPESENWQNCTFILSLDIKKKRIILQTNKHIATMPFIAELSFAFCPRIFHHAIFQFIRPGFSLKTYFASDISMNTEYIRAVWTTNAIAPRVSTFVCE